MLDSQTDHWMFMIGVLLICKDSRTYHQAETTNMFNMFSKLQTGFRKGRSFEDSITRLVQKIMDGFDQKPRMNRSVPVLLDFSEAYDTI